MGRKKFPGVRAKSPMSIEIDFTYRGARCRESLRLEPTPANLARAHRHRQVILEAIFRGTFDYAITFPHSPRAVRLATQPGDAITVSEYFERWLRQIRDQKKASTYYDYQKTIRRLIIPVFGALPLSHLNRAALKPWLATLKCSNKRIANILIPVRQGLQDAIDDEIIDHNPLIGFRYRRIEPPKETDYIDPFNAAEQAAIIRAARTPDERTLVSFLFWTGLRTSEWLALRWGDVDWMANEIHVRRSQTAAARYYGKQAEPPKTHAGNRLVRLLPPALDALKDQRSRTSLVGELIWISPRTHRCWTEKNFRDGFWKSTLKRAKVRYRYPYQTRHTYASMMLSAGENPAWVANQMGHKDTRMFFRAVRAMDKGFRSARRLACGREIQCRLSVT